MTQQCGEDTGPPRFLYGLAASFLTGINHHANSSILKALIFSSHQSIPMVKNEEYSPQLASQKQSCGLYSTTLLKNMQLWNIIHNMETSDNAQRSDRLIPRAKLLETLFPTKTPMTSKF